MGVDIYVEGWTKLDAQAKKMLDLYHSLKEEDISIPDEILDFFGGEPDEGGLREMLEKGFFTIDLGKSVTEGDVWGEYFIDVGKLPPGVSKIHIYAES